MRESTKVRTMTEISVGAVWLAVCSWITVPSAVPFTLQTFGVFLVLGVLGGRRGIAAIGLYILLGAAGAPVFAGFQAGFGHLAGPTGGYIAGFLFTALVYILLESFAEKGKAFRYLAFSLGLLVCYGCGTLWFMVASGMSFSGEGLLSVLGMCVLPYIIPDAVKMYFAVKVAGRLRKYTVKG